MGAWNCFETRTKTNSRRNIAEDDAHGMHIKILLKIYYYDMHVVSGKGKRLFQHMAHAPLQNNIQDGKSKMSHAVPFPTHKAASQKVLKERGEEGEETQN